MVEVSRFPYINHITVWILMQFEFKMIHLLCDNNLNACMHYVVISWPFFVLMLVCFQMLLSMMSTVHKSMYFQ
jgi:hypothetical protein